MRGVCGMPARPGCDGRTTRHAKAQRTESLRRLILLPALVSALYVTPTVAQETQETGTVTVTGNVVDDANGQPVAGVVVVLEALGLTLVTDDQGQFDLDRVPRGVYDLRLVHRDYERLDGDLTIDRPGEFFLGLTPIGEPGDGMITGIVGVVTDQVNGQPVPGVVVNVAGIGRVATTNEDGRFTLSELIPGRHDVVFSHLGYRPRTESI
ncbi:MAG: carboxypeptidase-like regulatory domain-containing protein, partial [Gemmatimonadetes bacterium]|nr:carboxypeptidase-like regulatory domain-containing protein [Gemmatimonadota bacterium]